MTRVAVARNKFARGFQAGHENAPLAYAVIELASALASVYPTEAHLVAYVVEGAERQPRVNKSGLALFNRPLFVECLLCDVDNPGHAEWTDSSFAAAREQDVLLPTLATAGVYYTKRGRRVVQPLSRPLPIDEVEAHLASWLLALEREGLGVDWACRDWTRHYLLPNVRRDGKPWRSRCIDLSRMRRIDPPVAIRADRSPPCPQLASRTAPRPAAQLWSETLPERWHPEAQHIAPALRAITGEWHSPFLALAGALLSRGLPAEHLPAFCGAVSVLTGADTRTEDRMVIDADTARSATGAHRSRHPHRRSGAASSFDCRAVAAAAPDHGLHNAAGAMARPGRCRRRSLRICTGSTHPGTHEAARRGRALEASDAR